MIFIKNPILFNSTHKTRSIGRNGSMITIGLAIYNDQRFGEDNKSYETVQLMPINSRGQDGHCTIEFPIDNIPELISLLNQVYNASYGLKGKYKHA